jgi:pantetheine-phosphate adenylyltransferase
MEILYPGTFDPITNGHLDVIGRASKLFDKIVVAIAKSDNKKPMFSLEERKMLVEESTKDIKGIEVDTYDCLLIDYASKKGVFNILRSLRVASDFEYELQLALMNRKLHKNCETIFLMPNQEFIFLSSSIVREIAILGGDFKCFVPKPVYEYMIKKVKILC